ncbi:uncharacterized protein PFL1_06091 [Pseudozyma flocculosa PF-1]|uniref:Potassium channel domain-containing protein n=1 Tax=Pseudozyma flocculosa PF-1 TaxID=1277687 RepID=A0A061H238_9BASI|nr:uncharacterized protein PFL1_06091 [Pseudozyma flocculosa PF-1]EPQ26443.1 hypothetical protein PFL1_06091 [Pseudozyma flocculosa PF-1]
MSVPAPSSPSMAPAAASSLRVRKTPIFSGVVAPLAIVLEVPGLTSKWYADIDPDGIVLRYIDNPPILTVGLGISLAAAVIANVAIILRFLEVLRPKASISIAIVGFTLHDVINLVALAVFGGIYGGKDDGLSLSASYWMVCASTAASLLVTLSLVVDYLRTNDYGHAGSGLTQKQKGLVLAVMALLLYLSLGSLMFAFLVGIDFISALYFSTATVLTVGFGDVVPASVGAKVAVILYAPAGIVLVALVVSSARNTILESFHSSFQQRLAQHRQRVVERRAARRDSKVAAKTLRHTLSRIRSRNISASPSAAATTNGSLTADPTRLPQDDALTRSAKTATLTAQSDLAGIDRAHDGSRSDSSHSRDPLLAEVRRMQRELDEHRQDMDANYRALEERSLHEARTDAATKIGLAFAIFVSFWLVGALAFHYTEGWSYFHAFWFCFIAMITIGYGDYSPHTQIGRGVFVMWGLLGVAVLTILLAVVQDAFGSLLQGVLTKSTARLFDRKSARGHVEARGHHGSRRGRRHHSHRTQSDPGPPSPTDRPGALTHEKSSSSPVWSHQGPTLHRHKRRRKRHRDADDDLEPGFALDLESNAPAAVAATAALNLQTFAFPLRSSSKTAKGVVNAIESSPQAQEDDSGSGRPAIQPLTLALARAAMAFHAQSHAILQKEQETILHSLSAFPELRSALRRQRRGSSSTTTGGGGGNVKVESDSDWIGDDRTATTTGAWTKDTVDEAMDLLSRGGDEENVAAIRMVFAHLRLQDTLMDLLEQIGYVHQTAASSDEPA